MAIFYWLGWPFLGKEFYSIGVGSSKAYVCAYY